MKSKVIYICQECGRQEAKWIGKCPDCGNWNTFIESMKEKNNGARARNSKFTAENPKSISDIPVKNNERIITGISEFDHILGGGIVPGSLALLAGPPGIGKSTLLLQVAESLSKSGKKCLYISGEESLEQIKLRADRLKVSSKQLLVYSETDLQKIIAQVQKIKPDVVIIDSIQTVFNPDLSALPGSIGQVRECAEEINSAAKSERISVIISGQVTKEGSIAGPKLLEHTVDTVLYFDETKDSFYRIIRAEKNRFGPTAETGIFQMTKEGLEAVENPSKMFLESRPADAAGSVILTLIEGSRPLLLELQALITRTNFSMPRRQVSGLDYNRVLLLVAVMERILGLGLEHYDIFLNIAGGARVNEPACDLSIIMAIYSAYKNKPVDENTIIIGEVGLAGEIRAVNSIEKRINEAKKLGFKTCIIPKGNMRNLSYDTLNIIGVLTIKEAVRFIDVERR